MRILLWTLLVVGAAVLGIGMISWVTDLMDLTFIGIMLVAGLVVIVAGSLFDIWRRADLSSGTAVIWTIAIIIFPVLGSLVYAFSRPADGQITYKGEQPT